MNQYRSKQTNEIVTAVQVKPENAAQILALGPVAVGENGGFYYAEITTDEGPVDVSAPGYIVDAPTKGLFGMTLEDFLAQYTPL